jgi:hypothetical protein
MLYEICVRFAVSWDWLPASLGGVILTHTAAFVNRISLGQAIRVR